MQITPKGAVKLTPAYDLVNTSIALSNPIEEMALELNEKELSRSFGRKSY